MNELGDPQAMIELLLSFVLDEPDVAIFGSLDTCAELLKTQPIPWQVPLSVGIHIAVYDHISRLYPESELASQTREVMQVRFLRRLRELSAATPDTLEEFRLSFHSRFAYLFFQLADQDFDAATLNLEFISSINFTEEGLSSDVGSRIVPYSPDLAGVKWLTAFLIEDHPRSEFDYEEILRLLTAASKNKHIASTLVTGSPSEILDLWASKCVESDRARIKAAEDEDENENPTGLEVDERFWFNHAEWLSMLAMAAEVYEVSEQANFVNPFGLESVGRGQAYSQGIIPRMYRPDSKQYQAWKCGQLVGRFLAADPSRLDHGANASVDFQDYLFGSGPSWSNPAREEERKTRLWRIIPLVASLTHEVYESMDLESAHWRSTHMFHSMSEMPGEVVMESTSKTLLADLGPTSPEYWALRVGLFEHLISEDNEDDDNRQKLFQDIETHLKENTLTLPDMLRDSTDDKPRLRYDIEDEIRKKVPLLHPSDDTDVLCILVQAEISRDLKHLEQAIVDYCKATEAVMFKSFKQPLCEFVQCRPEKTMVFPFSDPSKRVEMTKRRIERLSLRDMADVFSQLASVKEDEPAGLAARGLREFFKERYDVLRPEELKKIGRGLVQVVQLRGSNAHYQFNQYPLDLERDTKELRAIVLGVEQPSLLSLILLTLRL